MFVLHDSSQLRLSTMYMFVREAMNRRVVAVPPGTTVEEMLRLAEERDLLVVAVVESGHPIAVFTHSALQRHPVSGRLGPPADARREGECPLVIVAPDELTTSVHAALVKVGATVAVVVDHDDVIGVVTVDSLTEDPADLLNLTRQPVTAEAGRGEDRAPDLHERVGQADPKMATLGECLSQNG